jgi:uncharacterized membrane protein
VSATSAPLLRGAAPVERIDRFLAVVSLVLLLAVLAAVARGYGQWSGVPPLVWAHLVTIVGALALTVVQMWRAKGGRSHRAIGAVWVSLMFGTALISLFIVELNDGGYSIIHVLSAWVMIQVPLIALAARKGQIRRHRKAARAMVIGALLIAGFFTFPFHRLLGSWLFG